MFLKHFHPVLIKMIQAEYEWNVYHQKHHKCIQQSVAIYCFIYNKVPDAKRTACWAHIRRYLTDAIPEGKALDYTQPSVQGMLYINQLFHLEDVIKIGRASCRERV